jgi:hypothetical protein
VLEMVRIMVGHYKSYKIGIILLKYEVWVENNQKKEKKIRTITR